MPVRTCIGCHATTESARLLRLARGADGVPRPDPTATLPGRGAWVHPRVTCVEEAARRGGLARALRLSAPIEPRALVAGLRAALRQEIERASGRWERSGCAPGPLARRLEEMRAAEAQLVG